ncbi:MAG: homoserine dehydrogenase [Candidatus Omnitrophica bacterium]|nr:homoserine dehydrogenase [Candidatus Omnitrophota bacterium]MCM8777974.1 homoserine dehydrogenase [Candidatus Omnitrophota bacterium]
MDKRIVRIGILGCGTVGSAVIKSLLKNRKSLKEKTGVNFIVSKVCDKDIKKRCLFPSLFTPNPEDIINSPEIDIVVELIGGTTVAFDLLKSAIDNKKSVVTANKAVISEKGKELFRSAEEKNVHIGFEASVAGAIPIIKTIRESFVGSNILKIYGILNGTTNYILTEMFKNSVNFSTALSMAKSYGYAEADPSLDIKGIDTAHKISILSTLAFSRYIHWKDVYVEGIENIESLDINFTAEFGYRIKLLAVAKREKDNLEIRVHPTLLSSKHLLSFVDGVYNAVYLEGDMFGKSLLYGEGAGGCAAGSAVIADIVDIGKKLVHNNLPCKVIASEDRNLKVLPIEEINTRYYFRFTALDRPGVLAGIARVLGNHNISIASVIQKEESPEKAVPILMLTHQAKEVSVRKAIKEINNLPFIKSPTRLLRVEE